MPHRRQITDEQSPQVSGSFTSTAHTAQYKLSVWLAGALSWLVSMSEKTLAQFEEAYGGKARNVVMAETQRSTSDTAMVSQSPCHSLLRSVN